MFHGFSSMVSGVSERTWDHGFYSSIYHIHQPSAQFCGVRGEAPASGRGITLAGVELSERHNIAIFNSYVELPEGMLDHRRVC